MPIESLSLVGAGGHAKVVLEAIRACYPGIAVRVFDESTDNKALLGITVERLPGRLSGAVHIAIGDASSRERVWQLLAQAQLFTVAHPSAGISPTARIEQGVFAAALCVIGPEARVGRGVIVNHGAIVDHDCAVGEWSHIAPNATLGGGVSVGRSVMIGAGATVLPGVRIGERAIVGAGAVVLGDVAPGATVHGIHKGGA